MQKRLAVIFILILLLSACTPNKPKVSEDAENDHPPKISGDLREGTASASELPDFLNGHADDMKTIYTAVASHRELLEHIPCYCGCAIEPFSHKDNYDCFIHENNDDGSVVWDDHATRCPACLNIALESMIEYKEGKSIKEIRTMIDEKYKSGYSEPTPTPEV